MKKRLFTIPLLCLFFAACFNSKPVKTQPNITRDTLTYTYQTIKERADDCNKTDDKGCSMAFVKYPVFNAQEALNDTLKRNMLKLFDSDPDKDLQTQAKNFIASYTAWKKALQKKGVKQVKADVFKFNLSAKVVRQDSALLTLQIDGSSLAGNKHPIALTRFYNWNTITQKPISLDSILVNNYRTTLTAVAEKIFRKQENLTDTSSLALDYFFKGGKFSLNNNYLITPIGIRFLYNVYEIKPFAAGITDLFIPYTQIKTLIKPKTVLAQYIK